MERSASSRGPRPLRRLERSGCVLAPSKNAREGPYTLNPKSSTKPETPPFQEQNSGGKKRKQPGAASAAKASQLERSGCVLGPSKNAREGFFTPNPKS